MRLRDNDVGLLWDRSIRPEKAKREPGARAARSVRVEDGILRPMPEMSWTPPHTLPDLPRTGRLCVDVETKDPQLSELGPGVRRPGNYVIGIAIGTDDGRRWYFPMRHEGGGNLDERLVWMWAREELNAFRGTLVGANLSYDLDWLAENGVTFPLVECFDDVQVAEPLIDEWRYEFNLDALSLDYLGEGKEQGLLQQAAAIQGWKTEKQIKSNLWRLPASYVGPYAEGDVDRPLRILPLQEKKMEAEELGTVWNIERRLIPILVKMTRRGVPVNLERAHRVREDLVRRRDEYVAEMRRLSSPKAELMIPESFVAALREKNLPIPLTAKTKAPSIKKEFFEKHAGDPLVDAIANGRKLNTIINTFLDGHILGHQINGRIHCSWRQLKDDCGGTIARIASADPNLANVPSRDEEIGPLIRGIFEPEQGEKWQRDDMSQIEYRLGAHFGVGANAEKVRQQYIDDPKTDFHKLAASMCGIDPEDKVARKRVKNINFAKGYGAQAPKLAFLMKCSIDEAKDFIARYDRDIPFMQKSFDAAKNWADKHGFVRSILGRRQHFNLWVPRKKDWDNPARPLRYEEAVQQYGHAIERYKSYAAWNRKMQSSNADIMKKAMVDGYKAGICADDALGTYLVTVYDELDVSVPPTPRGDEAGKELTRIIRDAVTLKVPILVESDRGDNWGACG